MKIIRSIIVFCLILAMTLSVANVGIVALATEKEQADVGASAQLSDVAQSVVMIGDVDVSGKVNVKDATAIQKLLAVLIELTEEQLAAADTDENGKVNIKDATAIQKWCAKILTDSVIGTNQYVDIEPTTVPETLPVLGENEYHITYNISSNDSYLASLDIENNNPLYYASDTGLKLSNIHVEGYLFEGWYDGEGMSAVQVKEIPKGTTGNVELYAHWTKVVYEVSFASDMYPVESIKYTIDQEIDLVKPAIDKYTFVGWSDKDGNMWNKIPVGTTGNFTLYANWASNRNKAVAVDFLDDPIIIEDADNGLILFTYEIGTIENVPLFTTLNLNCVNGIISTHSQTEETSISTTTAKTVAQTISNATTNSASWTLSNNWNKTTEVSQSYIDQTSQTREEAETLAKSSTDTYNLSTSFGGTNTHTNTNAGSFTLSGNQSHSETNTTESGQNFNLSVDGKYSSEASAGLSIGDFSIGGKKTFELGVGADYGNYVKNTKTGTDSWSNSAEISQEHSNTHTSEKSWNTSVGYENSSTTSMSSTVSNAISKLVSEQYGYGESYAEGGSNSEAQELATTDTKSDEFSTTMTYFTSEIKSTTTTFESTGNTVGDYRLVMAGKVHVFAVVGYSVADKSYFVYTYNVLDDNTEEYLDYSYDGTFTDYETSILPFEVPIFVNDYVNSRIAMTDGLRINLETGVIDKYVPTGDEPDTIISIPSYVSVNNGDGTFRAVKVTGISSDLFRNNTDVVGVILGHHISEIPDNAFEGCSSLKYVVSTGVTKIGGNAFNGCTSLNAFALPAEITSVGTDAFKGVPEISAVASSAAVAQAVAASGADRITVDISAIPEGSSANIELVAGNIDHFEIQGKDKEYKNLCIKSDAKETIINGINIIESKKTALVSSSKGITLNRFTVDTAGQAMMLTGYDTKIILNGNVSLSSDSDNTVICRNLTLEPMSATVVGEMKVDGKLLVCGKVEGEEYLTCDQIEYIDEATFEQFKNGMITLTLDANGGTVSENTVTVYYGSAVGELPVPVRTDCTFDGWFTAGGKRVTSDTVLNELEDTTLKAHWTSGWILESQLPVDAQQTDSKWTYKEKSYLTSTESSLSGYTLIDSYWEKTGSGSVNYASFPGGFDTNNGIYTSFAKSAYSAYENESEKREVSNSWAGYVYWHWMYDCNSSSAGNRAIYNKYGYGPVNGYLYKYFGAFTSSSNYTAMNGYCNNLGLTTYYNTGRTSYADSQGSKYWFRFDYYTSTYTDYVKYYRYYTVDAKESDTEVVSTADIYDVQVWVKYTVK